MLENEENAFDNGVLGTSAAQEKEVRIRMFISHRIISFNRRKPMWSRRIPRRKLISMQR